jgi:hypothetical protein
LQFSGGGSHERTKAGNRSIERAPLRNRMKSRSRSDHGDAPLLSGPHGRNYGPQHIYRCFEIHIEQLVPDFVAGLFSKIAFDITYPSIKPEVPCISVFSFLDNFPFTKF